MGLYDKYILPHILDFVMGQKDIAELRQEVVPAARGRVLEVGMGSGLNLPFYGSSVETVVGLDPSRELLKMAARRITHAPSPVSRVPVSLVDGSAEDIPFEDASFDTVLTTWTLCSIPDGARALSEMRRVLKPSGELVFIEHGRSPEARIQAWQDRLTPLWRRCSGGCHMNRDIGAMIRAAGFAITRMRTGYMMKGPRPLTYHYEGAASRG